MERVKLPYGDKFLEINPALVERVCAPAHAAPQAPLTVLLERALAEPCGTPPLKSMLGASRPSRAVIVIDDNTRPTPCAELLPPVLKTFNDCGIPDESVKIIIAPGTHRPMTEEELIKKTGSSVFKRLEVINPDYESLGALAYYGFSESGIPIWINRIYAGADFKMALGTVMPHGAVGFSGGAKIIYPGIAGRETVEFFHRKANSDERNTPGKAETPIRLEIESMVRRVGLDFIIQSVQGADGRPFSIFAGDFVEAHRKAAGDALKMSGIELPGRVKILIAGACPSDGDFWQAAKCIFNCQGAVEDGGWLIVAARCMEGIPVEHALFDDYVGTDPGELAGKLERAGGVDAVTAAPAVCLGRFRKRINIGIVSEGLTEKQVRTMKFAFFKTMDEAIKASMDSTGADRATVVPRGGEILPIVKPRL